MSKYTTIYIYIPDSDLDISYFLSFNFWWDLCVLFCIVRFYFTVGARNIKHFTAPVITSAKYVYATNKIGFDLR